MEIEIPIKLILLLLLPLLILIITIIIIIIIICSYICIFQLVGVSSRVNLTHHIGVLSIICLLSLFPAFHQLHLAKLV